MTCSLYTCKCVIQWHKMDQKCRTQEQKVHTSRTLGLVVLSEESPLAQWRASCQPALTLGQEALDFCCIKALLNHWLRPSDHRTLTLYCTAWALLSYSEAEGKAEVESGDANILRLGAKPKGPAEWRLISSKKCLRLMYLEPWMKPNLSAFIKGTMHKFLHMTLKTWTYCNISWMYNLYIHMHIYTCIFIYIYTHTCTYTYTGTHTHTCTCSHRDTHTHKEGLQRGNRFVQSIECETFDWPARKTPQQDSSATRLLGEHWLRRRKTLSPRTGAAYIGLGVTCPHLIGCALSTSFTCLGSGSDSAKTSMAHAHIGCLPIFMGVGLLKPAPVCNGVCGFPHLL
jgi:hypothetical protein